MKLSYLSVKNFRSIESLEIKDFGQINTFFGPNNSGKSNILSAIGFGIYGDIEEHWDVHFGSVGWGGKRSYDIFLNDPSRTMEASIRLSLEDSDREVLKRTLSVTKPVNYTDGFSDARVLNAETLFILRTFSVTESGIRGATEEVTLDNQSILKTQYKRPGGRRPLTELLEPAVNGSFHEVSAFRKFAHEIDDPRHSLQPGHWIPGEDMKKALFDLSHSEEAEDRKNFDEICEAFSSPPFSYGEISVTREKKGSELRIMVDTGSFEVPIENLGSGPQQVLMILTNVLRRKGHIVAIEEPECNLAPESQRDFAKKLTDYASMPDSPVGQLLISTHSSVFGYKGTRFMVSFDGTRTVVKRIESEDDEKQVLDHFAPTWKDLRPLASKK